MGSGDGCTATWVFLTPLNRRLTMVKKVNLCYVQFTTIFKKAVCEKLLTFDAGTQAEWN